MSIEIGRTLEVGKQMPISARDFSRVGLALGDLRQNGLLVVFDDVLSANLAHARRELQHRSRGYMTKAKERPQPPPSAERPGQYLVTTRMHSWESVDIGRTALFDLALHTTDEEIIPSSLVIGRDNLEHRKPGIVRTVASLARLCGMNTTVPDIADQHLEIAADVHGVLVTALTSDFSSSVVARPQSWPVAS